MLHCVSVLSHFLRLYFWRFSASIKSLSACNLIENHVNEIKWGGGGNSKKVNTHPKIREIDLDFFRLLLTFNKIVQILS